MPSFVKHNHEYCKDRDTKYLERRGMYILLLSFVLCRFCCPNPTLMWFHAFESNYNPKWHEMQVTNCIIKGKLKWAKTGHFRIFSFWPPIDGSEVEEGGLQLKECYRSTIYLNTGNTYNMYWYNSIGQVELLVLLQICAYHIALCGPPLSWVLGGITKPCMAAPSKRPSFPYL